MGKGLVQVTCLLIAVTGIWSVSAEQCEGKPDDTHLPYKPYPPEPNYCKKFIECFKGRSVLFDCPPNYRYNDGTKGCVLGKGDCRVSSACTSLTSTIPDDNCKSYFTCIAGSEPNTFIPDVRMKCDLADDVNKFLNPYGPDGPECTTNPLWICPENELLPNCALQEQNTFLGDPNSCTGYYICLDGMRMKGHCRDNLHFNPKTGSCIYAEGSECKLFETGLLPTADLCKGNTGRFVTDPNSCSAYIYCISETLPYQTFCPAGTYFNGGSCGKTVPANCGCEIVIDSIAEHDVIQVKASSPDQYWICTYGGAELRTCPDGSVYNSAAASCMKKT